jgi:hypothetical protein
MFAIIPPTGGIFMMGAKAMAENEQLLKNLLQELKSVLAEPYASDQAKVLFVEYLINRYTKFQEKPGSFTAAQKIIDRAKGAG